MNQIKLFIGTGFFSGLIPIAPGTAGSLAVLIPIYFLLKIPGWWIIPLFILTASLLSLWVSSYFESRFGKDPVKLVIDEWAGQAITFLAIPLSGFTQTHIIIMLSGFLLFRFFDILKPLGINKLQDLPNGWGILADDLLAGFYALICLKTLIFVWPNLFGMA